MSFLLLKNGEATKARCCQCAKLYAPKEAEIEASKRKGYGFMCAVCRDAMADLFPRMVNKIEWEPRAMIINPPWISTGLKDGTIVDVADAGLACGERQCTIYYLYRPEAEELGLASAA